MWSMASGSMAENRQQTLADSLMEGIFHNEDHSNFTALRRLVGMKRKKRDTETFSRKEKTAAIVTVVNNFISVVLQFPLLLVTVVIYGGSKLVHYLMRKREVHHEGSEQYRDVVVWEDYTEFWRAGDLETERDAAKYRIIVRDVLVNGANTEAVGEMVKKEILEIMIRNYIRRLQVWREFLPDHAHRFGVVKLTCQAIYAALLYGNSGLAMDFLTSVNLCNQKCNLSELSDGYGITLLHLCIFNQQHEIVVEHLRAMAPQPKYAYLHTRSPAVVGPNCMSAAELPLNLAVVTCDTKMVRILVEEGAEMCEQDSKGYNVFHAFVYMSLRESWEEIDIDDMYDTLIQLIPVWIERTQRFAFLREMTSNNAFDIAQWHLLKAVDETRLTPLKLAANLGQPRQLQKLVETVGVYRFPHRQMGCKSESLYDVSELDPYITQSLGSRERACVLEMVAMTMRGNALLSLGEPPISTLAQLKWAKYWSLFATWGGFHIGFMITVSLMFAITILPNLQPLKEMCKNNSASAGGFKCAPNPRRFEFHIADLLIVIVACIYSLFTFTLVLAAWEMRKRCRNKLRIQDVFWVLNPLQNIVMMSFDICVIAYMVLKSLHNENEVTCLALVFITGWMHSIMFFRVFRSTAFFSFMIDYILFGDMIRFCAVILLFLNAFSFATGIIYAPVNPSTDIFDLLNIMLSYFKLGLGIADFPALYTNSHSVANVIAPLLYVMFVVTINLLILNLLIASMTDVYASLTQNRDLLCRRAVTIDVIFLEWLFPFFIQWYLAVPTTHHILRIRLPDNSVWQNHVYLMVAPSPKATCADSCNHREA